MKLQQRIIFLFNFLGLRKNLSIFPIESSCSWMLHRNKLLFPSYTEKHLFRVTTQELSIFEYLSLIPEKKKFRSYLYNINYKYKYRIYLYISSWLHAPNISISMLPIFFISFCSDNVMENRCEKETFISNLLLFNIVLNLGTGTKKNREFPLTDKGKVNREIFEVSFLFWFDP